MGSVNRAIARVLWVDGVSAQSNSGSWGSLTDAGSDMVFGRRNPGSATREWDGKIFQVLLFNRKLTTAEVGELYNGGAGGAYGDFAFA